MPRRSKSILFFATICIAITSIVLAVSLDLYNRHIQSIYSSSIERCFDGYVRNMNAKEVSELLQVPVVIPEEFSNHMPNNVKIKPDGLDVGSGIKCGIAIEYNKKYGEQIVIEVYRREQPYTQPQSSVGNVNCNDNSASTVLPLNLVRPDRRTTAHCVEYSNSEVNFKSSCWGTIYKSNLAFDVLMLTQYTYIETARLMCSVMFWEPENN